MEYSPTRAQVEKFWTVDYTCGCGLYVHPDNPLTSKDAIHISDCKFNNTPKEPQS